MATKVDYKGHKGFLIMVGAKKKAKHFRGEVFVAVIQYGDEKDLQYDVVPDSTDPADVDGLPAVQTFSSRSQAIQHFMKLENNKENWKPE